MTASIDHCVIGLRILNNLVDELNIPITGRTLTQHRKTAVSFRDQSLLDIFNVAFNILQQLQVCAVTAHCWLKRARRSQNNTRLTLALRRSCEPPWWWCGTR